MGNPVRPGERRHEERLHSSRVTASGVPLDVIHPFGAPDIVTSVEDVSTGGARIVSSTALEQGDPLAFRLDGANHRRSVSLPAEVRWVKPLPGRTKMYMAGVRFMRVPGVLELLLKSSSAAKVRRHE